ncbi:C-reactive protein-like [Genypterus blacodes]|uniref:C-reactive protein-like n=1 Tax=Genypterus blacodes TaxID=154954 RepID=UPI003F76FBB0
MRTSSLVLASAILLLSVTLGGSVRSLIFGRETSTSYAEMVPEKSMNLRAFTLCMSVATEIRGEREIILFAYRTQHFDELNVWRELDGRLSFYLSGEAVMFDVPQFGALHTHMCVRWDSKTGAAAVFMDGRRSMIKSYKKGHTMGQGGKVILGQDPDRFLGDFDAKQSFIGEITEVNMWDSALPDRVIQDIYAGKRVSRGNVFDWESVQLQLHGDVEVIHHE